ncbi:DUF1281 family ferredoxin-like fold protein [Chryseobacterium indoltheticum]|uniref:YubB ferredoxin-like domain-containing protein n=1 Tax=Chryseobacterium indoltheticum TaxID=254 RepID=A0A3G6N728_9FLAO|nr:hypothetical protein [Chryseobacterium indoltheticum]AZA60793.1 hypothetical protein EG340_06945 [Chryseobacterium indoltheticum]
MPNYIKNRITIIGTTEQVSEVFDKYNTHYPSTFRKSYDGLLIFKNDKTGEYGWLDEISNEFTRRNEKAVIGLPDDWTVEITPIMEHFPDFEKIIQPPKDDAYNDLPNQREAEKSPSWWRTWNLKYWGTKWNSSENEKESDNTFTFITAWSGVPELIRIMSSQIPDVQIDYEYADEDTGYNCASYSFKNGEVLTKKEPEGGTLDAYELSFKLRPDDKEYYNLEDGAYVYIEE